MSKPLIVIPARMGSTRFPGKPLAEISGISMLRRTAQVAQNVRDSTYVVATDHAEIQSHCQSHGLPVVMTPSSLASGSDRALAAAQKFGSESDIIVNLQGDAPFTDPSHISAVIEGLLQSQAGIATPYIQLSWKELDDLRVSKKTTPFSGTTILVTDGQAIWFSKNIIPAIRDETALRTVSDISPVRRHIGLYAYRRASLLKYTKLAPGYYETLEGLEQLRALENGMTISAVKVDPPKISSPGIDTPDDLARAEALIVKYGDPFFERSS